MINLKLKTTRHAWAGFKPVEVGTAKIITCHQNLICKSMLWHVIMANKTRFASLFQNGMSCYVMSKSDKNKHQMPKI